MGRYLKAVVLGLALLAETSASAADSPLPGVVERSQHPTTGEAASREVGEALVEARAVTTFPGLRLTASKLVQMGVMLVTFHSNELQEFPGKTRQFCGPANIRQPLGRGDISRICTTEEKLKKAGVPYALAPIVRDDPANFRQELVFLGRSARTVRLAYREYAGDMTRPSTVQDLSFDLADDAVIGAKGARLEVLDLTNTSIRYRLLQPFSSAPSPAQ